MPLGAGGELPTIAEELGLRPSQGPANGLPGRDARHSASFMLLWLKLLKQGAAAAAPPHVSGLTQGLPVRTGDSPHPACPDAIPALRACPLSQGPSRGLCPRVKVKFALVSSLVGLQKSGKSCSEEVWSAGGTGAGQSQEVGVLTSCLDYTQGSLVPFMDSTMTEERLNEVKAGKLCPVLVRIRGPVREGWAHNGSEEREGMGPKARVLSSVQLSVFMHASTC